MIVEMERNTHDFLRGGTAIGTGSSTVKLGEGNPRQRN